MEWYKKGEEGIQEAKKVDAQKSREWGPNRFWLPPDKSTNLTFLDTEGFFFREHQMYLNGSWQNWETCIQDIGKEDCPLCEAGIKFSYVCMFTVLDHSQYTSKKSGELITVSKKLLVLKKNARNKVLKQKERREGDLSRCQFEVTRYTEKESSTGEDFEFIKRLTPEEIIAEVPTKLPDAFKTREEYLAPFDYAKQFAPRKADDLRLVIGHKAPVGSEDKPPADDSEKPDPSVGDLI